MKILRIDSRLAAAGAAAVSAVLWTTTASAQLDPLLFLKRVPPTVVVAFDTSFAMLEDDQGNYYDPNTYVVADDPAAAAVFGLDTALQTTYRRKYVGLLYDSVQDASRKWETSDIVAVGNTSSAYASFFDNMRYEIARKGVLQAVQENAGNVYRWGLVKQRQDGAAWRTPPGCDKPVRVTGNDALLAASDSNPCQAGGGGKYAIYAPLVNNPNYSLESGGNPIVVAAAGNTAATVAAKLNRTFPDANALIPASRGERGYRDRPLSHLLDDAKSEIIRAMGADGASTRSCRNSLVVLVVSGPESGNATYAGSHNVTTVASSFSSVTAGGFTKRVPIFVVAVKPLAADEAQLQQIATNSGGMYFKVTTREQVTKAVNRAVQAGFNRATDFDLSYASEFTAVSPIIGTVNLAGGVKADGSTPLENSDITMTDPRNPSSTIPVPQRSNVMVTAGFSLPGFEGRIRAFRTFRPEYDATRPSKYKFVADGSRLWPDLDGRPALAGLARIPADPGRRNIYTVLPAASGPGTVISFSPGNAVQLAGPMGLSTSAAGDAILAIRALPLGAVIGSTPAIMDAPSLDPPPDDDYGRPGAEDTFANTYENRRSIIFVGANDGMIHAIDARTGYEVWAFIPYNLLPKLKTLLDGQPVEQFDYFVDSSPKIAEVKMNTATGHQWRSLLIIGQGPGGTFYQAFDVTEAGMGVAPDADGSSAVDAMLQRFDAAGESIEFKWSFPNYYNFDTSYYGVHTVADATSGGKVKMFGDLKATATTPEKTVGFTWSDPAVGPLNQDRTVNAVIVGSGYFPAIEDALPGRGGGAPRAGRAFYLLKIEDGTLLGSPLSCGSANGSLGCMDVGVSSGMKNAIQADPSAAGDSGSHVVNKAYVGDLSGKYWKFTFTSNGALSKGQMIDLGQPIFSSSALLFVGTTNVYMFFSTGSDLLPHIGNQGIAYKLVALQDNYPGAGATTKFTKSLTTVSTVAGGGTSGERPSTAPSVAGDIVFFTTTTEDGSTPCGDMTANLYGFTYLGGAAYDSAASGNNRLDSNESPLIRSVRGRATAPFIVDQHLYFATAGGSTASDPNKRGVTLEMFGDPEDFNNGVGQVGIRILSWREIR